MRYKDLTGYKFGLLTVTEYAGSDEAGGAKWLCVCSCGGVKIAKAVNLRRGRTASCGCLGVAQRIKAASGQSHELSKSRKPKEYAAWSGMIRRCYNSLHPSHVRYGGRGISVCKRWKDSFANFYADMGEKPANTSLERIDNNADYSPENCCWASKKEQANNRRSNKLLTYNGVTMNVSQWADSLGWRKSTITTRLFNGWTTERALTEPPRHRRHAP